MPPRAVMDTNVLDAAFRTRAGASFQVFLRLRQGDWRAVLSNHLLLEYEEVLKRHAPELGLSLADVDELLNAHLRPRGGVVAASRLGTPPARSG